MNFVSGGEILMINKIHDEEIRILISDSNPENRKAFSKALKEKYLIIEAENGAETLRVLVEENYSIDLMIIANKLSRDFLSSLNYIPENPGLIKHLLIFLKI